VWPVVAAAKAQNSRGQFATRQPSVRRHSAKRNAFMLTVDRPTDFMSCGRDFDEAHSTDSMIMRCLDSPLSAAGNNELFAQDSGNARVDISQQ
jgi:hypothetical protein